MGQLVRGVVWRRLAFFGANKQGSRREGEREGPLDSRFLYGPRFTPFFLSLRWELTQASCMPYLTQRRQGLASSHFLQAFWQFVHAFLTCLRFTRWGWSAAGRGSIGEGAEDGIQSTGMPLGANTAKPVIPLLAMPTTKDVPATLLLRLPHVSPPFRPELA